ncbi:hypothetical protein FNH22_30800 [Fulvivirga sp. M361]|uniref:hypothetical protein n=1 Tax=Fulvivirga sp. M361 TaxID=2594266 RepID=UPI00117A4BD9|nr:hypothetical protein [Fulvivirga sp. M361]TRX46441.1 hypothetical protein FNH22_30800 [Fulvivirga sp. M361]
MRIIILSVLIFFKVLNTYSQSNKYFKILPVNPTIIVNSPTSLKVIDTLDLNRRVLEAQHELGGLEPRYPIAQTYERPDNQIYDDILCLRKYRTLSNHCTNYIVQVDGEIVEVFSKEKFKQLFAPVDSKEEALSFAFALSDVFHPKVIYDFAFLNAEGSDYEIYRKELSPTAVSEVSGGYEVVLFSTYWGYTSRCTEVIIFVSRKGDVKVLKKERLFHDKKFDLIID